MTFEEQVHIADEAAAFIVKYGLKAKYVAEKANIKDYLFSRFIHHKLVLTGRQLASLQEYMTDYAKRMA